jgi:hypothetical protein
MALSASSADAVIQGVIRQHGKKTIVSIAEGEVSVRNRDAEEFLAVASGDEVVITASNQTPRPVELAQGEEQKTRRRLVSAGFFGTKKGMLIAGGTVAAVAGGIAIGASSGGSSSSSNGSGGGSSASPFVP